MATTPTNSRDIDVDVDVGPAGPREWFLSADELVATRTKINTLNRRATKKGFTGSIELVAEPAIQSYIPAPGALPVIVHGFTVTISGQPPSYAGWRFVAAVDAAGGQQPAPITRSTDLDRPAYFHQVQHTILGADGTGWPATTAADQPTLYAGERVVWSVLQVDPNGDRHLVSDHGSADEAQRRANLLDAALTAGGQPQFQLPDLPAGALLRYPPGAEQVIDNNLVRPGECDHCNTNRPRTTTFLVQHEDTGALKQVGRSCLKDFLGHSTRPVFIDTDQVNDEIDKTLAAGWVAADWDLTSVLTYAWAVVETHGWTPVSAAAAGRDSTRDLVGDVLSNSRKSGDVLASIAGKLVEGGQLAPRIITDLLDHLDGSSGYQANLAVILRARTVNRAKHLGLAVSAINAWQRLTANPAEQQPAPPRTIRHAGTVGEPITLTGTITTAISVDGYHYNSPPQQLLVLDAGDTIAKMVTAAGWADHVKLGEQITITAVVKAHADYHGIPQTVLTRPKRLPDPAPAGDATPPPVQPLWETVKPVSPSRFQKAALAAAATPAPGVGMGLAP